MAFRRVTANTVWNFGGQFIPLVLGIAVLPSLIGLLGMDRFGFLSFVWVVVGYVSLFDLGLSRAMTRTVAGKLREGDAGGAQARARTGLTVMVIIGALSAMAVLAADQLLVERGLGLPDSLKEEASRSVCILAISVPFVVVSSGYLGVLTAFEEFRAISLVRIGLGVSTYVGPLVLAHYSTRLEYLTSYILLMRLLATVAYASVCRARCGVKVRPQLESRYLIELVGLGRWMFVSSLISPLMTYLDRLVVGGLVSIVMVGYYATSYDVVSKSMLIPYSMLAVVFPIAAGIGLGTSEASRLARSSLRALFVVMVPVMLTLFTLSAPLLALWLGNDFAEHGAPVIKLLSIGLLVNALAQVPATLIQAAGNPRSMALLHLLELPIFVAILWWLTGAYGITGTALATALRFVIDAVIVSVIAWRSVVVEPLMSARALHAGAIAATLFALALGFDHSLGSAAMYLLVATAVFGAYGWRFLLRDDERREVVAVVYRKA